jgi:hypothetical protein
MEYILMSTGAVICLAIIMGAAFVIGRTIQQQIKTYIKRR